MRGGGVAVAALSEDRHIGQVYELTGPRLLTFSEAAHDIAEATGRDVQYVPVTAEEYKAAAAAAGVPAEEIEPLIDLFARGLGGGERGHARAATTAAWTQ